MGGDPCAASRQSATSRGSERLADIDRPVRRRAPRPADRGGRRWRDGALPAKPWSASITSYGGATTSPRSPTRDGSKRRARNGRRSGNTSLGMTTARGLRAQGTAPSYDSSRADRDRCVGDPSSRGHTQLSPGVRRPCCDHPRLTAATETACPIIGPRGSHRPRGSSAWQWRSRCSRPCRRAGGGERPTGGRRRRRRA